nr:lipid II flippase MurJ [Conyzicola lurida]
MGRASALLASGTIVSRLLGFVSAWVLVQAIGSVGAGSNTFAIANQLPNSVYAIIAGGLLSAVLVPQIVRAGLHDDGGQRFLNRLVTLGLTVFVVIAVIATLAAPWLVSITTREATPTSPGLSPDDIALATAFAYWCLPQVLFYAIYSLLGEVLNARKIFGPFTWTPVLNNLVAIAGMIVFIIVFGGDPAHRDSVTWTPAMTALLAGTATLGIAVQGLSLFFFWRRAGLTYRPDFHWRGVGLGATGKAAAWVFGMILVTQLAGIVQTNVASGAASTNYPSARVLSNSWLIFMLPHSIVAVSIATAYFTRMSSHARDGNLTEVRADFSASLRSIGLFMVFCAVGLVVLAYPFSSLLSPLGAPFGEIEAMAFVVMAFLVGLVPFSILFVIQRTFYSVENTRTPFFLQLLQSVIFVVGALAVGAWFAPQWIGVGIAAVTAIAGSVQALVAAFALRGRLGSIDGRRILRQYATFFLAALPAAGAGVALLFALGGTHPGGFAVAGAVPAALSMALIGGVMAIVYFGLLVLMRNPELGAIVRPVVLRLRRRG